MSQYHFYLPLDIRYGDLDPQGHLNNAHTVILFEQARTSYLVRLGLWDGKDFSNLGLIVADIHVAYLAPVVLLQKVQVGLSVTRIGNKSLTIQYALEDCESGNVLATAETIMVAYDYHTLKSIPVPEDWRRKISDFEGQSFSE